MPLSAGTRLGSYEILAPLGAGGMGEVYRARDTKLKRDVALKVLPEAFARDPERMARFQREAEVLASLNHPNIAAIYGVEERALVMELVEGASPKGPLPFEEAWKIASQIASALEYAHERGIIHRDLKPSNIMVTAEGPAQPSMVKLLDFGLAKAFTNRGDARASAGDFPENSPTLTMGATEVGVILGTAGYMPPEQAKGKQVDKRADIWSFGVVLYELLTGERLFRGEDTSETLAQVLTKQPDFEKAPAQARPLLRACLEKDPRRRLCDIGDAQQLLNVASELLSRDSNGAGSSAPVPAPSLSRLGKIAIAAAGVLAVAALALGFVSYRHVTEEPPRVLKMFVPPPDKAVFQGNSIPAVSPDGRRLALVATIEGKDQLWVRDLDSLTARALSGTEGASYPFWSPDSRTVAFFAVGKLKKIDAAGGPPLTLCDAVGTRGGTWNKDGVIVFGVISGGIFRVPAAGGSAVPLTKLDAGEIAHRYPWFLPDGRHFLYSAQSGEAGKSGVYAADLQSKDRKRIVGETSNAVYAPPGYLLFVREQTLMAQPFDDKKLETMGDATPIAEHVDSVSSFPNQTQFSISQNGVLAYTSGSSGGGSLLTWFDRSGKMTGTLGVPDVVGWGAISPDGKTVAVDRGDQGAVDIWLHDLARGTASRFTFGPRTNEYPVWSPDGSHIAFFSFRDGVAHPFQRATSGTAQDELLSKPLGEPSHLTVVNDWSRDGRYLILVTFGDPKTRSDVWVLPTFGDRKPFPYLQTEFAELWARLSPDGHWLAYTSDESKRNEIYVQSFPTPGGKWPVSTNGGERSVWSRDGKELYFVSPDGKMMAAEVKSGSKFEAGVPKPLFDVRLPGGPNPWFDVGKDGRFLIPIQAEQTANAPMTVVVNWQAELKK
ncbi:MAG TPA: protein kinase [Bryobacteraceae bacterium]|nr:protein kinase [Bryobacteraceae bacterium]